jgi:hypothetical protein
MGKQPVDAGPVTASYASDGAAGIVQIVSRRCATDTQRPARGMTRSYATGCRSLTVAGTASMVSPAAVVL